MLFITILLARRIGARYVIRRPLFPGAALALFLVFAFACSRMAAVSRTSDIAPLALMGSLCAVVLAVDCRITRKREARFIGPYEILGLIGSGGMGAVYRARETTVRESRVVALKVLKPDLMVRKDSRERFVREARLGAIIQHPGVVEVFGSGECEVREGNARMHTAYIVMEYVDGSSLGDILHREKTLPIWRCVQIVRSAAQALEAAHSKGVLHRDIKTDNILISKDGEVKLADFGIAKASYMTELTSMGTVVGTLVYMSPEQMLGETIDARSDLYSLGVVLYVLLTGRLPFDGDNPMTLLTAIFTSRLLRVRSLRPDVPEELDELVHRTLSPERDRRPSSAAELAAELSKILAAYPEAQSARRMTPTPKKLKTPLPAVVDPNRTTVRVEKKARPGAKKDS
jgi:serine/threonine-protein kinase